MKFLFVALLISSCSVYKSSGRKNLESLGPPPGSIKTTSVSMKILTSNEKLEEASLEICKLSDDPNQSCVQHFACVETTTADGELVDTRLLVDLNNSQKSFDTPLVCEELDL